MKRDQSPDWNVPPCFGAIAHLVGRARPTFGNNAKLSEAQVREIKRLYFIDKVIPSEIARIIGTTRSTVSSIIHGHTWKNTEVAI